MSRYSPKPSEAGEIESYMSDPEHQYLNELMSRVRCPTKRQRILRIFDEFANTPDSLEVIRQTAASAK